MVAVGTKSIRLEAMNIPKPCSKYAGSNDETVPLCGNFSSISKGPKRFVECFMIESWLEYLCRHEWVAVLDRDVSEKYELLISELTLLR
jgi:hypothetical protein